MSPPAFKPHLTVYSAGEDTYAVLSEFTRQIVSAPSLGLIARLIDGSRDAADIAAAGGIPVEVVERGIAAIRDLGHLGAPAPVNASAAAFWSALGIDPTIASERLRGFAVAIESCDPDLRATIESALGALDITVSDEAPFQVLVVEDYLDAQIAAQNQRALDRGAAWMLVKPFGVEPWVGPIFVPGHTGCWACLAHAVTENRWLEAMILGAGGAAGAAAAAKTSLPTTLTMAVLAASTELARWRVVGNQAPLAGRVLSFNLARCSSALHLLHARPQCPCCKGMAHRRAAPLETHLSHITGFMHDLERGDGGDGPVRLYSALCSVPLPAGGTPNRRIERPRTAVGRGTTDEQARTACLAEAVERYCASFRGDEALIARRFSDIAEEAVHPAALASFRPGEFDEGTVLHWCAATSLTFDRRKYLPAAFAYLHYVARPGPSLFISDSTGCAAGETALDAILAGFLEVVERDAVAIWWHNRLRRPGLAVDTFGSPLAGRIASYFSSRDRSFHALDLTTDLGIPAVVAISAKKDGSSVVFGAGAALDARVALERAASECVQVWTGVERDASLGPAISEWLANATLANSGFLMPSGDRPRQYDSWPPLGCGDVRRDIAACIAAARRSDLETIALDLTRPEIGMPVCRVVVPGMRSITSQFGVGRLRDLPVRLGWLSAPAETPNPAPFPI